jgi:3'-phosphoadenosine 5'-phosphosulfate sulfotransferase (PAPS reductase)/FAD synthetase
MQSLPLSSKILMTKRRIREWYDYYGGDVYVSFSGGKDSTVLVDLVQKMGLTDVPLVFCDTGLEYPEIREFVKSYGEKVTWLKPEMNFKQVIQTYGYPFISKEVSFIVAGARKYLTALENVDNASASKQAYLMLMQ